MGLDKKALGRWLDSTFGRGKGLRQVKPVLGGTQNILVRFTYGDEDLVLRMAPAGAWGDRSKTMLREFRILKALEGTGVPHPSPVALCTDDKVLGASFFIMKAVDGYNPAEGLPPMVVGETGYQRAVGFSMADCIATLGTVDITAEALKGIGRPDGWLERQVDKWAAQLDGYSSYGGYADSLPYRREIELWLRFKPPTAGRPGLLHGDFHFGNVILNESRPEIAAVVDWELATVGDPLVEMGHLLATWPDEDNGFIHPKMNFTDLPTSDDLIKRYADHSDRDVSRLDWYRVLASYRLGILLEGSFARAHVDPARWEVGVRLHTIATSLFHQAAQVAEVTP